jgi:hypothetical protein
MIRSCLSAALLLALLFAAPCYSDEPAEGVTLSLLDGETLRGWHATGCEAAVEDGALVLKAGDGLVRSDYRYRNFVLELEWKALKDDAWDSGIYFHAELPPEGKPWPQRYQINLRQGQEGDLLGVEGAKGNGLAQAGQWNRFRLTVKDKTASLEINGQEAWTTDRLETTEGYLGFQSEVPLGGQFTFRNIRVTELDMQPLFNGQDLAGWEGASEKAETCWSVENGAIVCSGERGTWLRSAEQYGDFCLRLEYLVAPGGNSGVYVRVPADGNHHGPGSGVEIQVLDDHHSMYANLKPYQYTGSVYAIAAAEPHVGLPAGEWNRLEIDVQGDRYRVTHNGIVVVHADAQSHPELTERLKQGYLGLQNHNTRVAFRHLRLGPPLP